MISGSAKTALFSTSIFCLLSIVFVRRFKNRQYERIKAGIVRESEEKKLKEKQKENNILELKRQKELQEKLEKSQHQ